MTVDLEDAPFGTLAEQVYETHGIRIFYRDAWVDGTRVSLQADSIEVTRILMKVLQGTGIHVEYLSGRGIFLLPDGRVSDRLPDKVIAESDRLKQNGNGEYLGEKGGKYMKGTRPEQIMRTIVVGDEGSSFTRSTARIRGKITDAETGEPVIGATMVIMETGKGSVTDHNGVVNLALEPGNYTAQFNFIGKEQVNCQLEVYSDGAFSLEMNPSVIALTEVQIEANQYRDINSTDVGVERMSMKTLKQVPVFMGEKDVIKISRLLPGITSSSEASSGVNVRGGSVDQNVFYVNRMPVYNTSHLFGFFSAFNSDIIRDFSIYKGNVPASYGGRLSSVFNIITRQGNNRKFNAHAGISPVSAHMTLEAPLKKEKASFILSGRSSYSDWLLQRVKDPDIQGSTAFFYDLAGSVNVAIDEKNELNAFYYQSFDDFKYSDLNDYEYANRGGSLNWKNSISSAFSTEVTATYSNYRFGHIEKNEISRAYRHRYNLSHSEALIHFKWIPAMRHKVEFGGNLIHYGLNRGQVEPYGKTSIRDPLDLGREQGLEGGLYVSDNIQVTNRLSVYAGLRYSGYTALGPKTVRRYDETLPRNDEAVTGTDEYGPNEPVVFYSGPEVRSAINLKAGQNTSFKLAFNQMRQYLLMLTNTVTISPTDQWKLTDSHITPPVGYQYSGGAYHIFPQTGVSASVELYYKTARDIVDYKDGASFISTPYTETELLQGNQKAYGAEFMLQRTSGRLNGWISYTLSKSEMHVPGTNPLKTINNGNPYPSNYDRPHVLNLVANYRVKRRITIASNVIYMTGRPVTYPSSLYFIDDEAYIDYYSRNQFRVPDYFRIDLSMTLEGNLKARKFMHSTWSFNIYNLLGRKNPQSLFFEPDEDFIRGYAFSVIGVPIFTVNWNVKLGNYDSQ